jgi:hypothetical protein
MAFTTLVPNRKKNSASACSWVAVAFDLLPQGDFPSRQCRDVGLVGQKLALHDRTKRRYQSGCTVAAQVVMVPMAFPVGYKADILGRKRLFRRIGHPVPARFSLPIVG